MIKLTDILNEMKVNKPSNLLIIARDKIRQYIKNGSKGDLNLQGTPITSLGNLTSVRRFLDLYETPITSLGNLTSVGGFLNLCGTPITSLGNLTSVGGNLNLDETPITSLGNLTSVVGYLNLRDTPISQNHTEDEIRQKVKVGGNIYM